MIAETSSRGGLSSLQNSLIAATAVPELVYAETFAAKWHFPQENATFRGILKDT